MPPTPSRTLKPDFELMLFGGPPPHHVHFETGAADRVRIGADDHQVAVAELDP